jgi:hypothetical protein
MLTPAELPEQSERRIRTTLLGTSLRRFGPISGRGVSAGHRSCESTRHDGSRQNLAIFALTPTAAAVYYVQYSPPAVCAVVESSSLGGGRRLSSFLFTGNHRSLGSMLLRDKQYLVTISYSNEGIKFERKRE